MWPASRMACPEPAGFHDSAKSIYPLIPKKGKYHPAESGKNEKYFRTESW
jgi:hypothetical protein